MHPIYPTPHQTSSVPARPARHATIPAATTVLYPPTSINPAALLLLVWVDGADPVSVPEGADPDAVSDDDDGADPAAPNTPPCTPAGATEFATDDAALVNASRVFGPLAGWFITPTMPRSEEHTSELQSRRDLVC